MHVRTLAACVGLVLLVASCSGEPEPDLAAPVIPDPVADPADSLGGSEVSTAFDGVYWSAGRVAALEAAKATFVAPSKPSPATEASSSAPVPDAVAAGEPPVPTSGAEPQPAAAVPAAPEPYTPPWTPVPDPAPQPAEPATPPPGDDPTPRSDRPGKAEPQFIVADRTAAILVHGCAVDAESGQRRLSYVVELRQPGPGRVTAEGNTVAHSESSRTELAEEVSTGEPIAFVLVEDDVTRTDDFIVPAGGGLHLVDDAGKSRSLPLPTAVIPVAICATGAMGAQPPAS